MYSKLFSMFISTAQCVVIWDLKSNAKKCHETIHINVKVIIKCYQTKHILSSYVMHMRLPHL